MPSTMTRLAKDPLFIVNGGSYSALPMRICLLIGTLVLGGQYSLWWGSLMEGCNFV